jgi:mannosyl-oligosaccharide alpha-1,3-glucosidase
LYIGYLTTKADVGGFFGNPEPELLVRWYQLGVFQPFFRAHAHIETERREPWLFGDEVTALIRSAVQERYRNLPYIYTLNRIAFETGSPIMRAMMFEFPDDENTFAMDDQFMFGDALMVKAVAGPGVTSVDMYLPSSQVSLVFDG